ncbi:hypothetical protein Clocel_2446 [Clostridium cellulovorans 743B]|uniref:Uncharacterized protein n=1 Tax=Clostridium cellulovorans (strain ATCC 35296 / DSM 3052 / OCM 3 / 743B) TaxID=573061 RepID=D9SQ23_CLOC7|nr:hypothetical protein Clocel_2446 [Clostridium cellulovorans 743B]
MKFMLSNLSLIPTIEFIIILIFLFVILIIVMLLFIFIFLLISFHIIKALKQNNTYKKKFKKLRKIFFNFFRNSKKK